MCSNKLNEAAEYDAIAKMVLTELNRNENKKMNDGIKEFAA